MQIKDVKCVVFDFSMTLYSGYYFTVQPPGKPNWFKSFQEVVFSDKVLISSWCAGHTSSLDIAKIMSKTLDMSPNDVIEFMNLGCRNLQFNQAVLDFAKAQKSAGRKTAMVTINMDIFSTTVVPAHSLENIFDVIINSADYKTENKIDLVEVAFSKLANGITFSNSLLIDDSKEYSSQFRTNGGLAYEYKDDSSFVEWLKINNLA